MQLPLKIETATIEVTRCADCPNFEDHPQEPRCMLMKDSWYSILSHRVAQTRIDPGCPLLETNKKP